MASWVNQHQSGRREAIQKQDPREKSTAFHERKARSSSLPTNSKQSICLTSITVNGMKYFKEKSCTKAAFLRPEQTQAQVSTSRSPDPSWTSAPESRGDFSVLLVLICSSSVLGCYKSLWGQTSFVGQCCQTQAQPTCHHR